MFSGSSSRKPYTAVTVHVDRLTGPEYEENDFSGIIDLIEVIRIQDSGPSEAARALRKKLKYGNADRQLRALTILDALISNAGSRFQRNFADEPLLERLRILARDEMVDIDVRNKCNVLFRQWAVAYKDTRGLEAISSLYKQLPNKPRPVASQSKVIRETEQEAAHDVANHGSETPPPAPSPLGGHKRNASTSASTPPPQAESSARRPSHPTTGHSSSHFSFSSHSKKSSKAKAKPFNLEKEKPQMLQVIAGASVASTNLTNALKLINRETQRVSEDTTCVHCFDRCKLLRRQILRYIQLVESDQWIGSLLTANDELVKALMAFEVMDKSVDDDSDSETELFNEAGLPIPPKNSSRHDEHMASPPKKGGIAADLAGLKLEEAPPAKPPRPGGGAAPARKVQKDSESEAEEIDENDPFGDQNEIR